MIKLNNNERLNEIREDNSLSQRDLASILNISKSTYARWETQEQIIPLNRLVDFCNYFKVSMDYALNLSNENKYKKPISSLDRKLIGNNIKLIRKKFSLTQQNLADLLNTSHSTISAYEAGKTLILTIFAYQICLKYNISLDWLCGNN